MLHFFYSYWPFLTESLKGNSFSFVGGEKSNRIFEVSDQKAIEEKLWEESAILCANCLFEDNSRHLFFRRTSELVW